MKRFSAKRAASILMAAFISACAGTGASVYPAGNGSPASTTSVSGESLTSTFNRGAVADTYGQSCFVRDQQRDANVRYPTQFFTPLYFQRHDTRLALYSPHLSPQNRREAEAVLNSIPRHIMDLFYSTGGVALFTERSLVEALPGYASTQENGRYPYLDVYVGLYRGGERRVFLTFNTAEFRQNGRTLEITGYRPVFDNRYRVFHHEIGHFIDDIIGELGAPVLEFGRYRFSDRQEYVDRLTQDMNDLIAANRNRGELSWRSYFLPKEYRGVELFGQKDSIDDIRGEVFAELWAEVSGHGTHNLRSFFPRTYALVYALNEDLKRLHAHRNPAMCRYDGYSPVRP